MKANGVEAQNPRAASPFPRLWRWLRPGLGVKRWFALLVMGTTLVGLGLAIVLLDIYRTHPDSGVLAVLSLRALPRWMRALLLGLAGTAMVAFGVLRLNRELLAPYLRPGRSVADEVMRHRRRGRGPRVVAVGGGTGLSTLLRGLKHHTANLTAVVTVADDGGSSGRLRRSLGLPPPGDIRNCLAALSDDEDLLTQLFQYRFSTGEELQGHSFGNLFIAALAGVTGSFERGLSEVGKVLAIHGRVVPSTLSDVALVAEKAPALDVQALHVEGESRIPEIPGRILRVYLKPSDPPAYPEALRAILNAELIIIGPGSLYTSVLPNLLVPGIAEAIRASRALKIYVVNVATQPGETDGYTAVDHLKALEAHVGAGIVDIALANDRLRGRLPHGVSWVQPPTPGTSSGVRWVTDALADAEQPWRHDAERLAARVMEILEEHTGPLELPRLEGVEAVGEPN